MQHWCRTDLGITDVSGDVTDWADQSIEFGYRTGTPRDWEQVVPGEEPVIGTRFIGGLPALDFDGGLQHMRQNFTGNAVSSNTFTWMFVMDLDNTSGSGTLWDNETERAFAQSRTNGDIRINTGANDDVPQSTPLVPQVLMVTVNGAASQVRVNGVQEDIDFTATNRGFDAEQSLFSSFTSGATPDGLLSEVALWSPALTIPENNVVSNYAIARYSL